MHGIANCRKKATTTTIMMMTTTISGGPAQPSRITFIWCCIFFINIKQCFRYFMRVLFDPFRLSCYCSCCVLIFVDAHCRTLFWSLNNAELKNDFIYFIFTGLITLHLIINRVNAEHYWTHTWKLWYSKLASNLFQLCCKLNKKLKVISFWQDFVSTHKYMHHNTYIYVTVVEQHSF